MNIHIAKDGKRTVRLTKRETDCLTLAERILTDLEQIADIRASEQAGIAYCAIGNAVALLTGKESKS